MQDECCYVFSSVPFSLSFCCSVSYVAMGFATTSLLSLHVAVPSATKGSAVVAVSVFLVAHLEAVCPSGSTRGGMIP